jgi:hypothetical protein
LMVSHGKMINRAIRLFMDSERCAFVDGGMLYSRCAG